MEEVHRVEVIGLLSVLGQDLHVSSATTSLEIKQVGNVSLKKFSRRKKRGTSPQRINFP